MLHSSSAKKVQNYLISHGFQSEVKELSETTRTAEEAAKAIGCHVGQIAKSLVFVDQATGSPVFLIVSGANRVDLGRVKSFTGLSLIKADGKFTKERLGFAIGGVPPAGHLEKALTFIDPDLQNFESIWAAAGTPFAVFRLTPDDLQRMTEGTFIELKSI